MEYTHDDCEKFITILIDKFDFKMENITLWLDLDKNNGGGLGFCINVNKYKVSFTSFKPSFKIWGNIGVLV